MPTVTGCACPDNPPCDPAVPAERIPVAAPAAPNDLVASPCEVEMSGTIATSTVIKAIATLQQ